MRIYARSKSMWNTHSHWHRIILHLAVREGRNNQKSHRKIKRIHVKPLVIHIFAITEVKWNPNPNTTFSLIGADSAWRLYIRCWVYVCVEKYIWITPVGIVLWSPLDVSSLSFSQRKKNWTVGFIIKIHENSEKNPEYVTDIFREKTEMAEGNFCLSSWPAYALSKISSKANNPKTGLHFFVLGSVVSSLSHCFNIWRLNF